MAEPHSSHSSPPPETSARCAKNRVRKAKVEEAEGAGTFYGEIAKRRHFPSEDEESPEEEGILAQVREIITDYWFLFSV